MLNQQQEWQKAFGQPDEAFESRVRQTLNQLTEEEAPMKRITFRTIALVAAVLLALTGVVYAASNLWNVADYFNNRYGDNVNAPKGFDSGFTGDYTQTLDALTFQIRDAYVEKGTLNAIVEIRRADGKPALFRGEDCMEDDLIENLYMERMNVDQPSGVTVAEYAKQRNLPLYWVETGFFQDGRILDGSGDYWMEADQQLGYFVSANDVKVENGQAAVQWMVYVHAENGELHRQSVDIALPVQDVKMRAVEINHPVEGLPAVLDSVTLSQGRMGLYIDYAWHIEESLGRTENAEALKKGNINLWFRCIDPETGRELPGGPSVEGGTDSRDDTHFTQTGDSVSADFDGDTLYIQPYDAWEKTTYGIIEVKIR